MNVYVKLALRAVSVLALMGLFALMAVVSLRYASDGRFIMAFFSSLFTIYLFGSMVDQACAVGILWAKAGRK